MKGAFGDEDGTGSEANNLASKGRGRGGAQELPKGETTTTRTLDQGPPSRVHQSVGSSERRGGNRAAGGQQSRVHSSVPSSPHILIPASTPSCLHPKPNIHRRMNP